MAVVDNQTLSFEESELPEYLADVPVQRPGSRIMENKLRSNNA